MKKKLYFIYLITYVLLFLIELIIYLNFNSTLFGLMYMVINLIVIFLLSFSLYNYSELNLKIRLSKTGILIFLMLMSILLTIFKYNDESKLFIKNIKVFVYYLKPIMILLLNILSIYDYKVKGDLLEKFFSEVQQN